MKGDTALGSNWSRLAIQAMQRNRKGVLVTAQCETQVSWQPTWCMLLEGFASGAG